MKPLLAFAFACCAAWGQSTYRTEVYGHIGYGWSGDDEGSIGKGVSGGGNIGWRVTPKFGIEADVTAFQHSRELPFITVKGRGTFVTGNALYHFRTGRVQPYVLFGGGFVNYRLTQGFAEGVGGRSDSGGAIGFGVGVKGFISERVAIRPEWRVLTGSGVERAIEPPLWHSRVSIGLGYRW